MEVEVRAKIKNLAVIKRKLKAMGAKFGQALNQKDLIFFERKAIKRGWQEVGDVSLRIREEDGRCFLTLKGLTERKGAWLEHEVLVDNPKEARAIVDSLGFGRVATIEKRRISGELEGISFNLDRIKQLGDYIEMEIITDKGKEAQGRIMEIFSRLGIDKKNIVRIGYPQIILKRKGFRFIGEK